MDQIGAGLDVVDDSGEPGAFQRQQVALDPNADRLRPVGDQMVMGIASPNRSGCETEKPAASGGNHFNGFIFAVVGDAFRGCGPNTSRQDGIPLK